MNIEKNKEIIVNEIIDITKFLSRNKNFDIILNEDESLMGAEIEGDPITVFNDEHWPVFIGGKKAGSMHALVYSPRLDKNICYTILDIEHANSGCEIIISSPEKDLLATTVNLPWFERA